MNNQEKNYQAVHFLETHYDVRFPYGYSKISKAVMGDSYFLKVGLIENLNDCSNSIRMNDIGLGIFHVYFDGENYILERKSHALTCKPENKYHALSLQKVSFRKIKAKDIETLVQKFDKYLTKWIDFVNTQVNDHNVYNQEKYDNKYFSFN